MGDKLGAMGTALYSKLAAGTALTSALGGTAVYVDQAPDAAALPYVVFYHAGGGPLNMTPRDMVDAVWRVQAYAATRTQANAIDGQVSALLHRGSLSVSGWSVFWLAREEDFSLVENLPGGAKAFMAGGSYRVRLSE